MTRSNQMSFSGYVVKLPGTSTLWNTRHQWTGMNYWYTRPPRWISKNYDEWKKPIPLGYILYGSNYMIFLRWRNCRNGGYVRCSQGLKRRWWEGSRCGYTRAVWGIFVVLEMFCVSTCQNPGCVILSLSFARCYHERKLGKGYKRSVCIISYNGTWTYNYLTIKSVEK